jgi:hypothetical protein
MSLPSSSGQLTQQLANSFSARSLKDAELLQVRFYWRFYWRLIYRNTVVLQDSIGDQSPHCSIDRQSTIESR